MTTSVSTENIICSSSLADEEIASHSSEFEELHNISSSNLSPDVIGSNHLEHTLLNQCSELNSESKMIRTYNL